MKDPDILCTGKKSFFSALLNRQSFYNIPHYDTDSDTPMCHVVASKYFTTEFYKGIIGK